MLLLCVLIEMFWLVFEPTNKEALFDEEQAMTGQAQCYQSWDTRVTLEYDRLIG